MNQAVSGARVVQLAKTSYENHSRMKPALSSHNHAYEENHFQP